MNTNILFDQKEKKIIIKLLRKILARMEKKGAIEIIDVKVTCHVLMDVIFELKIDKDLYTINIEQNCFNGELILKIESLSGILFEGSTCLEKATKLWNQIKQQIKQRRAEKVKDKLKPLLGEFK